MFTISEEKQKDKEKEERERLEREQEKGAKPPKVSEWNHGKLAQGKSTADQIQSGLSNYLPAAEQRRADEISGDLIWGGVMRRRDIR